ncbi:MAG: hypothetical protein DI551_03800 [Micavibrio aeruginosavorus]|uniref:OmpA-like domain-containing protein n=1 Tax=Micavibrio aeruginosavorus TaxID=349221 RepID=A0A2W5N174_9BACT|nr:MAG: hypothetical protein DI551_03800 [Micavibrio aeruginosavorus]
MLIVFPLGACESLQGDKKSPSEPIPQKLVTERLDAAPGVRPVPNFQPPNDRDLKVMTSKLSGGSVEIYSLDGDAMAGNSMSTSIAPVTPDYQGIPMATDPRVTIYPVDGGMAYPGGLGASPAPMPLSPPPVEKAWPNAASLAGSSGMGVGMTPAPLSFGGDKPMAIEGGKLASRADNSVSNIYFPYGSANLDGSDRNVLNSVAETAKFAPVDRVSVEGHASAPTQTDDPVKSKILNLKESMNRAQAVSAQLIEKGVPAEKIKTVGWGDTKLSGGSEAAQRRVDIITAGQ